MKNSNKLVSFLVPLISILLAFIIGCVIMAVLGANPFVALQSLWIGAFGSLRNVGTTLARSTPLISSRACRVSSVMHRTPSGTAFQLMS